MVGSELVDSRLEGADCVFHFHVAVPTLSCYELLVDGQPVGRYPASALGRDGYVGIITSDNVFGDPAPGGAAPRLYADFKGC